MAQAIRVEGLAQLNRTFGRLSKEMRAGQLAEMKKVAELVARTAATLAPRRSGRLAGSYKPAATNKGAAVYSTVPYAAVHEWGGTIAPRGTPIRIRRSEPVGKALEAQSAAVVDELGALFDRLASS